MKYTTRERKRISHAFKEAQKLLWAGSFPIKEWEHAFICTCLSFTTAPYAYMAMDIIQERLEYECYVHSWLLKQGVEESDMTDLKLQAYRHEWLNRLIKEFSE